MEVAYAILAMAADLTPDGRLHLLNGGIDTIAGPFPGVLPVPVPLAVKVLFGAEDAGREYPGRVELVAPSGALVARAETTIRVSVPANPQRSANGGFLLNLSAILFPVLGTYQVRIFVDDRLLKTLPLSIEAAPPG
jgi:hypothetical protein